MASYLYTFIYALNKKNPLDFCRDFVYLAKRQDIYNASFTDPSSELKASASPEASRWEEDPPRYRKG